MREFIVFVRKDGKLVDAYITFSKCTVDAMAPAYRRFDACSVTARALGVKQ